MKIIHFIASIDKAAGGTTAYMQLMAVELSKNNEVIIAAGKSPSPIDIPDVAIRLFDCTLKRMLFLKKEFKNYLKQEQPDLVHINGIWNPQNSLFPKAAQELGIKIILAPHGMLESYILARNPWKKKLALALYQHRAIKNADYLHATAEAELNQIRKLGYTQQAFIVPNGIDLSEIKQKNVFRKTGDSLKLLFLSRVHPKKGIEFLLEAVSILKGENIELAIAGTGEQDYIDSLKSIVTTKGIESKVDFLGPVYGEQKWKLYQESDVFVLPTYSENFGIVIAEALATGLPVITTTGTPWKELQTHQCGWWINLSVENLVETIKQAIACSPKQFQKMGQNGQQLIAENYDIKAVAKAVQKMYEGILAD